MKELSDTEAELKKSVLLKKDVYEDKSEILGINKKKTCRFSNELSIWLF